MAKGRVKNEFQNAAPPWGNKLPTRQPKMVVDPSQFEEGMSWDDFEKKTKEAYIRQLIADARKVDPLLEAISRYFMADANKLILQVAPAYDELTKKAFKLGPAKIDRRIKDKADGEYDGELECVTDCARSTIATKAPHQIAALCASVEWMEKNRIKLPHGAVICKFSNRFFIPTESRYRSGKIIVVVPVPETDRYHLAEIMITHEGFERDIKNEIIAKKMDRGMGAEITKKERDKDSHSVYEWVRYIEERYKNIDYPMEVATKYGAYRKQVEAIHNKAAKKNHIYDGQIDFASYRAARAQTVNQIFTKLINDLT